MAAKHRNTLMVGLLLKANADPLPRNASGEQAVDIAVANKDADIVTMLRMAGARQEMYQLPSFSDSEPRGGGCRKKSTLRRTIDEVMNSEWSNETKSDSSIEDNEAFEKVTRSLGSLVLKPEANGDPPKIPPKKPQRKRRLSLGHRRSRSHVPSERVTISKAMFNYGGPGEEHCLGEKNPDIFIPMAKGEKFEVIRTDHRGWTKVRRVFSKGDGRGREGFVPTDYLKEISTDDS